MGFGKMIQLTDEEVSKIAACIKENPDINICEVCLHRTCPCEAHNKSAKNVLIEKFLPLALYVAKKLSSKKTIDEAVCVALLTLVEAVNKIPELDNLDSVGGYIKVCIKYKVREFVLTDGVIKLKRSSARQFKYLHQVKAIKETITEGYATTIDIEDVINKVASNTTRRKILEYLIQGGFTQKEIAELIHMTPMRVSQLRKQLIKEILREL